MLRCAWFAAAFRSPSPLMHPSSPELRGYRRGSTRSGSTLDRHPRVPAAPNRCAPSCWPRLGSRLAPDDALAWTGSMRPHPGCSFAPGTAPRSPALGHTRLWATDRPLPSPSRIGPSAYAWPQSCSSLPIGSAQNTGQVSLWMPTTMTATLKPCAASHIANSSARPEQKTHSASSSTGYTPCWDRISSRLTLISAAQRKSSCPSWHVGSPSKS